MVCLSGGILAFSGHIGSAASICVAPGVARKIKGVEGSRPDRRIGASTAAMRKTFKGSRDRREVFER